MRTAPVLVILLLSANVCPVAGADRNAPKEAREMTGQKNREPGAAPGLACLRRRSCGANGAGSFPLGVFHPFGEPLHRHT
jgi:hypothetical protein